MKILTPHSTNRFGLEPGIRYAVENVTAGHLLLICDCSVEDRGSPEFSLRAILAGGSMALVVVGGYGDALFCTPTLAEIKRIRPDMAITVIAESQKLAVFENNPAVDHLTAYPVPFVDLETFDQVLWLEGAFLQSTTEHAVDTVCRLAGVSPKNKEYQLYLTSEESARATARYPRSYKRRIGIQVGASVAARSYPPSLMQEVIYRLAAEHEVFLFGAPGSLNCAPHENVTNLSAEGLSFRASCAVLADCDAALVMDSALCHAAAALRVPTVALYAAFTPAIRTIYSPTVTALSITGGCAPCFHHVNAFEPFPPSGPCFKTGRCEALAAISPDSVIAAVNALL